MSKRLKLVSGVLSMALITSMVILPSLTHAKETTINLKDETMMVRKHKMHLQFQRNKPTAELKQSASKSLGAEAMTSATFTSWIGQRYRHIYKIEVSEGGILQINTDIQDSDDEILDYEVLRATDFEPIEKGETITEGIYYLFVYNLSDIYSGHYTIELSGFTFTADTQIPDISLFYPYLFTRLEKGQKSFTAKGTTSEADRAAYQLNDGPVVEIIPFDSFEKAISVRTGYNSLYFHAKNASSNQVTSSRVVLSPGIERMYGSDRYITSAEIAKRLPVHSDTVVIAVGTNFPDALSGGPLAAWEGSPILLTKPDSLPQAVKDEVKRRGAKRAILLGGVDVVSNNVVNELRALGVTTFERKEGADRYGTSADVAKALLDQQDAEFGSHSDIAFIVTGNNYADALAASSPAGFLGAPILLVKGTSLPEPIKQVITSRGIKYFYVIGGSGVVSDGIYKQLDGIGYVKRLHGIDRYKTALAVAKEFTDESLYGEFTLSSKLFHVAYGGNYPDALSQGPLASYMGAPLLLNKTSELNPEVDSYLTKLRVEQGSPEAFFISGGPDVVSTNVENRLNRFID